MNRPDNTKFCHSKHRQTDTLVIGFSSFGVDSISKPFEYRGLLDGSGSSVVVVRDVASTWYHDVPDLDGGISALAAHLARHAEGYDRIVCLGSSMGGYAALLFGRLLSASTILAFDPQTVISPEGLEGFHDRRWIRHAQSLSERTTRPDLLDLAEVYARDATVRPPQVQIFLSDRGDPLDRIHADRLAGHAEVAGLDLPSIDHGRFAQLLRLSGALRLMIRAATNGNPLSAAEAGQVPEMWVAKRLHRLEIAGDSFKDGVLTLNGTVVLDGPRSLKVIDERYGVLRVGARLTALGGEPYHREYRVEFGGPTLEPGRPYPFVFEIEVPSGPAGPYSLTIGLLNEGHFWFEDFGLGSLQMEIENSPFRMTTRP